MTKKQPPINTFKEITPNKNGVFEIQFYNCLRQLRRLERKFIQLASQYKHLEEKYTRLKQKD